MTAVGDLLAVTSTRERLAVTAAIIAAAVLVALVTPYLVRRSGRAVSRRLAESSAGGRVREEIAEAGVRWSPPTGLLVRAFQAGVLAAAAVALVAVWGYVGVALGVVGAALAAVPLAARLFTTVALVAGAIVAVRVIESRLDEYVEESETLNRHQQGIVFRVLQVVLFVAAALGALSLWNVNLEGLLVGAGFLGIVVGMAARQTLGSLVAGFVLMFSRPFEIGDWVEIDDQEGIVTDITIVNTRIRNFDDETVILPNDRVSNATVVNRTKRNRLRVRARVGVDYDADLDRAEAVAEEAVEGVDRVMRVPSPQVVPVELSDSAVTLELRFWIDKPSARRRWQARAGVIRAVKAAFDEEGIKIPFPQRELTGREESGGFRVNEGEGVERPPSPED
ncbi:MAG: mechanosensitive ion channel family protein [Halobacteriaceae archaeon]